MTSPKGFTVSKTIHSTPDWTLCLARDEADQRDVLLKGFYGADPFDRSQREFERLRTLAGPGVARTYGVDGSVSEPCIVLAPFDGETLDRAAPLAVEAFIHLATELAATIRHLHAKHWIHRNLHPTSVLASHDPPAICLVDLERATDYGSMSSNDAVGDPVYMAPEQFGRMGRGTDYRSDLYSLGATLYYALLGRPPFLSSDYLELMHAHMAHRPPRPSDLRPDVPKPISDLLLKLLEKEPDDRYQTACTLHADLLELKEQWAKDGEIEEGFVLATGDAQNRPLFSKRLYGRNVEAEALDAALSRVRAGGCELWLLLGPPGVGKSVLIEELRRRSITDGWLVQGKFDLYQRDQPYSGWATALESLAQQILMQGAAELEACRKRIEAHLGPNVSVLAEWLPDWRFILGEVGPAERLGPRETQARLSRTTVRLLQAVASPEHPLILFLDDLQWTDSGSRILLEELMREGGARGLLFVATYRDGEVDATHPLQATLAEIASSPVPIHSLEIQVLTREATLDMLSDVFEKPRPEVEPLADLVATKTENNPFLIQQFINHMRNLGHVTFTGSVGWAWDLERIAAADISDDAVELIAARIEHVEPHATEVLVFASFIGDEFNAEMLRDLANRDLAAVEYALCALSEAGLVAPCSAGFRFVHDRIREAAQSLKTEDERSLLHYDTASLLLDRTPTQKLEERSTEIADHFKRALRLIPEERVAKVVQLDVWAAKRALRAGAPDAARGYGDHAHELVVLHGSHLDPQLAFDLDSLRAQSRILAFEYDEAAAIAQQLAERETDPLRFAHATALRIDVIALRIRQHQEGWEDKQIAEAFRFGGEAYSRLGTPYPLNPSAVRALIEILRAYWTIRHCTTEDFMLERPAPDEHQQALMRLEAAFSQIGFSRPYRGMIAIAFRVRRFRDGYAGGFLPAGLAAIGATLLATFGRREPAERLAKMCLELIERGYPVWPRGPSAMYAHLMVYGWTRHPSIGAEDIERCTAICMESGDLPYASVGSSFSSHMRFRAGQPLPKVIAAFSEGAKRARAAYDPGMARSMHSDTILLEALCRPEPPPPGDPSLTGLLTPYTGLVSGFVWLLFEDYARAFEALEQAMQTDGIPEHLQFHRALACTGLLRSREACDRRRVRRVLRRDHRVLRLYASRFPENRLHHRLLVDAELAALKGRTQNALELARESVECAKLRNFPVDAAIALERFGRMLFEARRHTEAAGRIQQAIVLYTQFGAHAKVAQLRARYPDRLGGS